MAFDEKTKQAVWNKGKSVGAEHDKTWRKDQCEDWIKFSDYGNRDSDYGWEIDHITPASKGGGDELSNLRPLHWQNNVSKSDGRLVCAIKSKDTKNVKV